jgi:hypothetical protein
MADSITDAQKLAELEAAMGIISVKHGENQTVFVADTSKVRGELQRRIRRIDGVTRTRVRYNVQTSKGY